jgi:carboxyl-terminal processing protease
MNQPAPSVSSSVKRGSVSRLVLSIVSAATLMSGVTWASQRYLPMPQVRRVLTPTAEKILDLLQDNYITPIDEKKLFKTAYVALQNQRKAEHLATLPVPEVGDTDRRVRLSQLEQFVEEAERNQQPDLSKATPSNTPSPSSSAALDDSPSPAATPTPNRPEDRQNKLVYTALQGLVDGLDDPFCSVFNPKDYSHFNEQLTGEKFGGIGVYMEADRTHENRLTVAEPIEGTPAFAAGILEGDVLETIDGESAKGWGIEKAVSKIRGIEGTEVRLGLYRPSSQKRFELSVKRAKIHSRSVSSKLLDGKYGYLRLRIYSENTGPEFDEELEKMRKKGAKALILDLRNNGGGYVRSAIHVCSRFLDKGQNIVSVVNARTGRNDLSPSAGRDLIQIPTVVLVNRFSASASEITAGALQDTKKARLIGEKTFGKASVQQIESFADGGAIKYTIAHYLTPDGKDIHKKGIEVDLKVPFNPESTTDNVLEAAKKDLDSQIK